jgi:hypothetical protein
MYKQRVCGEPPPNTQLNNCSLYFRFQNSPKDEELKATLEKMKILSMSELGIPEEMRQSKKDKPYAKAIASLSSISTVLSPRQKTKLLLRVSNEICEAIREDIPDKVA